MRYKSARAWGRPYFIPYCDPQPLTDIDTLAWWLNMNKFQVSPEPSVSIIKFSRQKQSPRGGSLKKVFLENSQNLQESTCARVSFLIKFY